MPTRTPLRGPLPSVAALSLCHCNRARRARTYRRLFTCHALAPRSFFVRGRRRLWPGHEAEPPLSPHIPTRPRLRLPCAELRRAPANAPPPSPTLESLRVAVFVCLRLVALPPLSPSPPRLSCIVALGALRWTRAVTRGGARCQTTHIRTSRAVGRCVSIDAAWRSCGRVVVRVGGRSGVRDALGKGGGRSCGSDAVGRVVGPVT